MTTEQATRKYHQIQAITPTLPQQCSCPTLPICDLRRRVAKLDSGRQQADTKPRGTFDREANCDLDGRVTGTARGAVNRAGSRPSCAEEQAQQRERQRTPRKRRKDLRNTLMSSHSESYTDKAALAQANQ
jgi:hypothetical protein